MSPQMIPAAELRRVLGVMEQRRDAKSLECASLEALISQCPNVGETTFVLDFDGETVRSYLTAKLKWATLDLADIEIQINNLKEGLRQAGSMIQVPGLRKP